MQCRHSHSKQDLVLQKWSPSLFSPVSFFFAHFLYCPCDCRIPTLRRDLFHFAVAWKGTKGRTKGKCVRINWPFRGCVLHRAVAHVQAAALSALLCVWGSRGDLFPPFFSLFRGGTLPLTLSLPLFFIPFFLVFSHCLFSSLFAHLSPLFQRRASFALFSPSLPAWLFCDELSPVPQEWPLLFPHIFVTSSVTFVYFYPFRFVLVLYGQPAFFIPGEGSTQSGE